MCTNFDRANAENPICIGHPFQRSTSGGTVAFSRTVKSLLRHWQLILRILPIPAHLAYQTPAQASAACFGILHIWRMKSRLRYRILHIWRFGNHGIWRRLSLQCFENLKSIFLCPSPDFNWGVGPHRTEIDVCVHQTPVLWTQFESEIHAYCLGREKSSPRVSSR